MLIVALVLAVIGLVALVTAVVTGDEVIAWVCIAASVLGVVLLIVDAVRERQKRDGDDVEPEGFDAEYPDDPSEGGTVSAEAAHPASGAAGSAGDDTTAETAVD